METVHAKSAQQKSRIVCYRLEASDGPRTLELPVGAWPLSATYHNGAIGLWVRTPVLSNDQPHRMVAHHFRVLDTGTEMEGSFLYLGTAAAPGGSFCKHVVRLMEADFPGCASTAAEAVILSRDVAKPGSSS